MSYNDLSDMKKSNLSTGSEIILSDSEHFNQPVKLEEDGYLIFASGANAGEVTRCDVWGSSSGSYSVFQATPINNLGSETAIFLRKGMRVRCTRSDGVGAAYILYFAD